MTTAAYDAQLAAGTRTPQDLLVLGVRYCANFYAQVVTEEIWGTEEFDSGIWTKSGGTTATAESATAPDGTLTADTLNFAAAADNIKQGSIANVSASHAFTGSVWLKAAAPGTITIDLHDNAIAEIATVQVNVTTSWTRFWNHKLFTGAATGSCYLRIRRQAGDLAAVYAWGANLYRNPGDVDRDVKFPYVKSFASFPSVSKCTAADAGDGSRCFYSFPTCQSPADFNVGNTYELEPGLKGIREFKFCRQDAAMALPDQDVMPLIRTLAQKPQEIDAQNSITKNEKLTVEMEDDAGPGLWDAYKSGDGAKVNTAAPGAGHFWRRWRTIFRNYPNPAGYGIHKTGFVFAGAVEADFTQRGPGNYLIWNVEIGNDGRATITLTDRLKILKTKVPAKISSTNLLNGAINGVVTTLSVDDPTQISDPPADGTGQIPNPPVAGEYNVILQIENEKMIVVSKTNGGNPINVLRGRWGTTAAAHADNVAFTEVAEFGTEHTTPAQTPSGVNAMDCIVQALRMGGLAASGIDTARFTLEKEWIPSTIDRTTGAETGVAFRRTLTEQVEVTKLVQELCEITMLNTFIDEDTQLVSGRLFAPARPSEVLVDLTESESFIAGSVSVDDNDISRFNQVLIGYNLAAGKAGDSLEDYQNIHSRVDVDAQSAAGEGDKRYKTILTKWLRPGDSAYVDAVAGKLLSRFRRGAALVGFDLELKDDTLKLGAFAKVSTALLQLSTGATASSRIVQIIRKERVGPGRIRYKALDTGLFRRYAFWAPAATPDYNSCTADQKRYGFFGDAQNRVGTMKEDGYYVWGA